MYILFAYIKYITLYIKKNIYIFYYFEYQSEYQSK